MSPGIFKGSSDQSHFIFEINVGKSRIRHITTLNLNNIFQSILSRSRNSSLNQCRCMSDPTLSDVDFKNKMAWVWTTLNNSETNLGELWILYRIGLNWILSFGGSDFIFSNFTSAKVEYNNEFIERSSFRFFSSKWSFRSKLNRFCNFKIGNFPASSPCG